MADREAILLFMFARVFARVRARAPSSPGQIYFSEQGVVEGAVVAARLSAPPEPTENTGTGCWWA